jgi:hypothetical protein
VVEMRRIAVVIVVVLAASMGPAASGIAYGSTAVQTAPARSLQADFDNDGADDLAIGVPGENAGSGAVNVLYGSASGLSGTGSQLFAQVGSAPETDDQFGAALASGDFNNDGFADLAVGAPFEDVGASRADAGAVSVLYGSTDGLTATDGQLFTQVGSAAEPDDRFGFALAAGDFDNDGFADLAASAPFEDVGASRADAGAVSVLYGSASRLAASGGRLFTQVGGATEAGDRFGFAVAAGDFNNNGFADLAAGAPLEDVGSTVDAGAVSEIPGSASGLTTTGGRIHTERSFTGPQSGDQFGFALAAADFNGDDLADLAVGVPLEDETPASTFADIGAVGVFFGRSTGGLFATFEDQHLQNDGGGLPEPGDRFGSAVAAGDFNSDGFADLAAGAPLEDVGSTVDAGAVSVLYGQIIGTNSEIFTQDTSGVGGSAEPGDRFGAALVSGDPGP